MGYVTKKAAQRFEEKKAAIYVRVSTQYQVDRASLPVQREELINYAKYALGISDYVIFEDAGYSAKNTDRPDYQQMMARMRTGEFSHLLVWKIDRISRNLLDFSVMYAELKELGVVFVSKNEQFDTSSAMGEAMLKIILIFAELERKTTSERVSAVFVSRANDGIWNGGKVPYGYSYDKESKTLEKKLLRGEALSRVDHIERPGLEELYNHLRSGFDEKRFESPTIAATESSADLSERDLLLSEKRRLERALNRLKTIYLYGDDEMASKDFNIERERITKALSEVDSRINELDIANAFDLSLSDEAFMQKASQFILTQQLLDKRYVNYERFIRKIDPKIVKDFLNETVSNFCIKDGLTTSILLKNGIELRFSYKTAE